MIMKAKLLSLFFVLLFIASLSACNVAAPGPDSKDGSMMEESTEDESMMEETTAGEDAMMEEVQ